MNKIIKQYWQPEKYDKDNIKRHIKKLKGSDGEGWHIGELIEQLLKK